MTRKDLRDMGITDEETITQILNMRTGEIADMNDAHRLALEQARSTVEPHQAPQAQPKPTESHAAPQQASAPDEVERLRRELAAERAKIAERETRDAILGELSAFKPKSADTLYRLLDHQKIVIENGAIKSGLKEQVEAMKTSQGYLFSDTPDDRGGADPGAAQQGAGTTAASTMNNIIRGK